MPDQFRTYILDMTGQIIQIVHKTMRGSPQRPSIYWVAEPSSAKAITILVNSLGLTDQEIAVVGSLTDAEITGLGLNRGQWAQVK